MSEPVKNPQSKLFNKYLHKPIDRPIKVLDYKHMEATRIMYCNQ